MLLGLRVGAHRQPHVVGVCDQAGPHLLAVDDVVVTVAHRRGAQRSKVGARAGLGVADGEVKVTRGDLGQEELLLLLGAERHDRRRDAVDGQERHRDVRDGGLVVEDEPVHGRARLAAELLGPRQRQPAVLAHLRDGLTVDVAPPHLAVVGGQCLGALGGHEFGEVGPQLAAQLLLLWGVADPHRLVLTWVNRDPWSDPCSHPVVTRSSLGVQAGVTLVPIGRVVFSRLNTGEEVCHASGSRP